MTEIRKVALILETSGGGSGRHVLDLAEGLAGAGLEVTVIWSPLRAAASFKERLLALQGVRAAEVEMQRAVGLHDLRALRALARCLDDLGPFDVLHGHSSKAGALVRLLPRRIPGTRIYTPHALRTMDPGLGRAGRLIYGTIERLLAGRADRIIAVSSSEYTHARALGIPAAKLATVVNGAALPETARRETARARMGLGPQDVAIGFIGRLDDQKEPLRFVDAVIAATRAAPAACGVVLGDGPLRAACEARAGDAPLRFLGWCDGPALFPGLDIFCMTSRYEAMPYTLIEALHAGAPIVTTQVGGVEETVIEGENGHILPLDSSSEAIGAVLAQLVTDTDRRRAFSAASTALAEQRTLVQMMAQTRAVYATATGEPSRPG